MTKITTIGITSPCGGNGCTTLAVHLAWFAAQRRGIRTLAVSMDRTGALVRHFLPDQGLRVDSIGRISPTLTACYFDVEATVSKLLPTLGLSKDEYPSVIVVDLGCGMSSDLLTDVDLWLTPVADVRTMRALLDTGYPRSGHAKTYISFNRSGGSQYAKRLLADAGDRCNDLSILRAEIPHSGAISRASHRYETVWQHSAESRAAASLKTWADEVLHLAIPKWQADEARQPKVPGAGLSADELLRMDQNLLKVSARKIERVRDEMLCPVCKKTSLSGRQQICSTKCRSASYRARLRGGTDPIPGVSRLRMESDRHTRPTDDRSEIKGYPVPTTQVDLSPDADSPSPASPSPAQEPLLPIVEPVAASLAGLAAFDDVDDEIQQLLARVAQNGQRLAHAVQNDQRRAASGSSEPPIIEQEVVPTKTLSIRRSMPKSQLEAEQVKPRKSFRPFSRFSDLQERIDAANAKLEAASLHIGRSSPRKPL